MRCEVLANRQREAIVTSIEKIHAAYAALDFFKTGTGQQSSLNDLILPHLNRLIDNQQPHQQITIQIGARNFAINLLRQQNGTITCIIHDPAKPRHAQPFKKLAEYQQDEKIDLICSHEMVFSKNAADKFVAGVIVRKNKDDFFIVGGPGKVDLYRDHLIVLSNVHQYLVDGNDASMLIALTTGAGKTFVQALWLLVLYASNVNGIFALPNNLIPQFKLDLKKLLPDEIVNQAFTLLANAKFDNTQAIVALNNMANELEQPTFIIASYESILDKYFSEVMATTNTIISFDEQHLVVEQEIRKIKLREISQRMMQMLLTATPDKATYDMCDRNPVAYLSSKDKEKAGHGAFPKIHMLKAKNFDDIAADLPGTLTSMDKFYASIVDAIEPQRSSAAHTLLDSILNDDPMKYVLDSANPKRDRWNYQPPLSRKSLTICYDSDELINLNHFIFNADEYGLEHPEVYRNGNLYPRDRIFNSLLLKDKNTDEKITRAARKAKRAARKARVESGYGPSYSVLEQLDHVVFSGIIDDLLSMVTGLSLIELNAKRKANLLDINTLIDTLDELESDPQFVAKYTERLTYHSNGTEEQKRGIDACGAERIAKLMLAILKRLKTLRTELHDAPEAAAQFITNSTLSDNGVRDAILADENVSGLFAEHVNLFRVVYLIEGLVDSETSIADSVPFCGFTEESVVMRNADMSANSLAKVREHSIFEEMDVYLEERQFTPNYLDKENVTEVITDNYFKRGYIGMYVTNKKTEGFSDVNLHTEFSIVPTQADKNNAPRPIFQGFGRLRALDATMLPLYFNAVGRDVQLSFDLRLLNREGNYYGEFIDAQENFNSWALPSMAEELAKQIRQILHANMNMHDELNIEAYSDAVQLHVLNIFRVIYNDNAHDLERSKEDLKLVLKLVGADLKKQAKKLQTPYKMTGLLDFSGLMLDKAYRVFNHFKSVSFKKSLNIALAKVNSPQEHTSKNQLEVNCSNLYVEIIKKSDFIWLQQSESNILGLLGLLVKKKILIEKNVKRSLLAKLQQNPAVYQQISNRILRYFIPLLVKFVCLEKQAYCFEHASKYAGWLELFVIDENILTEFSKAKAEQQAQLAIMILRKIPALRYKLEESDGRVYNPVYVESVQDDIKKDIHREITGGAKEALANYLQGGFLLNLKPFFVSADYKVIAAILSEQSNAKDYATHLIDGNVDFRKNGEFEPRLAVEDFIKFFGKKHPEVKNVSDISKRADDALQNVVAVADTIQAKIVDEPASVLSPQSYVEVARLLSPQEITYLNKQCHDELLPGMVKFYESTMQDHVLVRLDKFDKWHEVLFQLSDEIKKVDSKQPGDLFEKILRLALNNASTNLSGFSRNYEEVCKTSALEISNELKKLFSAENLAASPLAIVSGLFGSIGTAKSAKDSIGEEVLANYISNKLAPKLEPFFYNSDHKELSNLFADKALSQALAGFIIGKYKEGISFDKPAIVLGLFKEFLNGYKNGEHKPFADNLKMAHERLAQVSVTLQEKANQYADEIKNTKGESKYFNRHPSYSAAVINTAHAPVKQEMTAALKQLLPVLLCSVKPSLHQRVADEFNASLELPGIFAEMRDELTTMDGDNVVAVTFKLLNRIGNLKDLNAQDHGIDASGCQKKLQDDLKQFQQLKPPYDTFAVNNLAAYIKKSLSEKIREFVTEADWKLLRVMLSSDAHNREIAEKIIKLSTKGNITLDTLRSELKNTLSADPDYRQLNLGANGSILLMDDISKNAQKIAPFILTEMKTVYANNVTDTEKEAYFRQEMMAYLKMGALKTIVSNMAAHLSKDSLRTLLDVFNHPTVKGGLSPELEGFPDLGTGEFKNQFVRFVELANKGQYNKLYDEFIKDDWKDQLDNIMANKPVESKFVIMLSLLRKIIEEQVLCHFHFFNVNMSERTSSIAMFVNDEFNQISRLANQREYIKIFRIFRMAALRRAMPLNSGISFATNEQLHGYLCATIDEMVTPLVETIETGLNPSEKALPSILQEDAVKLGEQIRHLTPMSPEVIHNNDHYVDAIDPLINHVKANQKTWLADWWVARNDSTDLQDIDHRVQYCDIRSNKSLQVVYDLATRQMKSDYFSDQFELVHQLRRRVYALMALNTYREQNKPNDYANAVDGIVKYMERVAQKPLAQHKFVSTTFNKMKAILADDKLAAVDKLIRIQFLARDYRANTLHNIKRSISHFFSRSKYEEGVEVARFCEAVGKVSLSDKDGIAKMNSFLTVDNNNLANVVFNLGL